MTKPSENVKELLHRLRGENFRQERNAKRVQAPSSSSLAYRPPSLPPDIFRDSDAEPSPPQQSTLQTPRTAGPVPKSWNQQNTSVPTADYSSKDWREHMLTGLIYKHLTPPANAKAIRLPLLCLLVLYQSCEPDQFLDEVLPHIPAYLRRDFIRYCAIHHPVKGSVLYRLADPWGHVDGELIIIGPEAQFRRGPWKANGASAQDVNPDLDWESNEVSPQALQTLILVSTNLSMSTLLSFPFTLIRLALINVGHVPIQKLTTLCPLLEILDLSYNGWLKPQQLWEISWNRWASLRILGLRGMAIPNDFEMMVNQGRWDDVQIITL